MDYIILNFPVTESEYFKLDEMFGDLAHYAAWQLVRMNVRNNHTNEVEDIAQDLRMAMVRAGSYYKRQTYIENCMRVLRNYVKRKKDTASLDSLEMLWRNRTKHGANRQKFGLPEEQQLDQLVQACVPADKRPDRSASLTMDTKFITYCKTITWNSQRAIGKRISKFKGLRNGLVSIDEHPHLCDESLRGRYE